MENTHKSQNQAWLYFLDFFQIEQKMPTMSFARESIFPKGCEEIGGRLLCECSKNSNRWAKWHSGRTDRFLSSKGSRTFLGSPTCLLNDLDKLDKVHKVSQWPVLMSCKIFLVFGFLSKVGTIQQYNWNSTDKKYFEQKLAIRHEAWWRVGRSDSLISGSPCSPILEERRGGKIPVGRQRVTRYTLVFRSLFW